MLEPEQLDDLKNQQVDVLSSNLQLLMEKQGITATELSRQINVPRATINKILYGRTEDPRASTLKAIADYFNLTIDELFSTALIRPIKPNIISQAIPVISWEDCIEHEDKIKNITSNNWHDWIACDEITSGAYALKSRPSMEEQFPRGTTLIIDPSLSPRDGDYIVIHHLGTKEATLRQLSIDGAENLLLPISQASKIEQLSDEINILGVLVKSIYSYYS